MEQWTVHTTRSLSTLILCDASMRTSELGLALIFNHTRGRSFHCLPSSCNIRCDPLQLNDQAPNSSSRYSCNGEQGKIVNCCMKPVIGDKESKPLDRVHHDVYTHAPDEAEGFDCPTINLGCTSRSAARGKQTLLVILVDLEVHA